MAANPPDRRRHDLAPEPLTHRQERVVRHQDGIVFGLRRELGAREVPREPPLALFEDLPDGGLFVGALFEDDPSDHHRHVHVGQVDVPGEPALQSGELGGRAQRRLSRPHHHELAVEPLADRLDDLLHDVAAVAVLADVLLDLVKDDRRTREASLRGEGFRRESIIWSREMPFSFTEGTAP